MTLQLTFLAFLLALASLDFYAVAEQGLTLDITHNDESLARSGYVTLNCGLDSRLTSMDKVTSIVVYGSHDGWTNDQMAAVDIWSKTPYVTSGIPDFSVDGSIGTPYSHLKLTWNCPRYLYRHGYRCKAFGIDKAGLGVSITTTKYFRVKVESTQMDFDLTQFDVSDVYQNKVYLASKLETRYTLARADNQCLTTGGYLVELDNDEESNFVLDFAKQIGGSDVFLTGGNDMEQEGKFVYYHSKRPVPDHLTRLQGQPNSLAGSDHCMFFSVSRAGLNDAPCDFSSAKYICEVNLRSTEFIF